MENVFAVCGTIGAGKTTLLKNLQKEALPKLTVFYENPDKKILKKYYKFLNFMEKLNYYYILYLIFYILCFLKFPERFRIFFLFVGITLSISTAFMYYIGKSVCFETQIYFLSLRLKNEKKWDKRVIIGKDRSFLEDKLFPLTQLKQGFISKSQYSIYKSFYDEYSKKLLKPKIWIYLDLSPKKAYKNLKQRDIEKTISLKYLKLLGEEYEKWKNEMIKSYPKRFIVINVNEEFVSTTKIKTILEQNNVNPLL